MELDLNAPYQGVLLSPLDERDYKAKEWLACGVRPIEYKPPRLIPVQNQGLHSCCVGEALALQLSYMMQRANGPDEEFSNQFIYHDRRHPSQTKGKGMYPRYALSDLVTGGSCLLSQLSERIEYTTTKRQQEVASLRDKAAPQKIARYFSCSTDEELADAIFQSGAGLLILDIKISFALFYGKPMYAPPILPHVSRADQSLGSHAVCAIGYDPNGIWIQNSYGTEWGQQGLAIVPWGYEGIQERWGIVNQPQEWNVIKLKIGDGHMEVNGIDHPLDVVPQIIQNRTMVPLRAPFEALGADVEYLADTQEVIIRQRKS